MVNRSRMLQEFLEMITIQCSTRHERQIAEYVKAKLAGLKLVVTEDDTGAKIGGECGNVFAYRQGNVADAPTLLFAAHLDCVEPCADIKPQIVDGRISSDGKTILGADDKAGVAAILEALRMIDEKNIACGDIQVVLTVAEEGGLNGSKNMDKTRLKADMGFELDSTSRPGGIIIQAPGQNKLQVTIHGKTAHAGLEPELGVNAITVAGKALAQVADGRIDGETTANIGMIRGGQATNIVPDRVELCCEARSREVNKLEALTRRIAVTFNEAAEANGARAEVVINKAYNPYTLSKDAPVVVLAQKAAEKVGLQPILEATGGGSDANFYNNYGVPCTVLGVGMQKVHTTEEFILEQDLYASAELVAAIIELAPTLNK
ncbi:M20/M25/M40 family metallo-hydrolase [Sporomusa acidovorans]|uniref:Peptidase T n=1 Tax=Sporomusa acidovorans (strain ATCC 49682 / DSM 3132 / Mol) TaxID=1123286 RepID=A0ABZ3JBS0_SPOA4|nr:M20/M25/M40 family metallo-hydrolase [Sporomusa acidovorans]OZC18594.1 peptidase T [Sporomusa acidovorans DSM 3132]SDF52301.1 peptidase T-like protein [Sporomusa acidovorans]